MNTQGRILNFELYSLTVCNLKLKLYFKMLFCVSISVYLIFAWSFFKFRSCILHLFFPLLFWGTDIYWREIGRFGDGKIEYTTDTHRFVLPYTAYTHAPVHIRHYVRSRSYTTNSVAVRNTVCIKTHFHPCVASSAATAYCKSKADTKSLQRIEWELFTRCRGEGIEFVIVNIVIIESKQIIGFSFEHAYSALKMVLKRSAKNVFDLTDTEKYVRTLIRS